MCYHCLRMMIANRTDPATGIFKGLELGLGGTANEKATTPEARASPAASAARVGVRNGDKG